LGKGFELLSFGPEKLLMKRKNGKRHSKEEKRRKLGGAVPNIYIHLKWRH
jgi:hypothetical protein